MRIGGLSDPGQVKGRDWRTLAKTIGVGSFVEDTVRDLAEELPARARQTVADVKEQYGRLAVGDALVTVIRKGARRTSRLLKL
jgi:hypothetical protein